jgi:hypothetical protein
MTRSEISLEDFRKDTLERSLRDSDMKQYNDLYYQNPPTIIDHVEMTPNKIIAGFKTLNYTGDKNEIVVSDIEKFDKSGKPLTLHMLIVGENGTGKSVFAAHAIYINFCDRFNEHVIIYDPKDEWEEHDEPSFSSKQDTKKRRLVDKLLNDIGEVEGKKLERKGYPAIKISPYCRSGVKQKGVKQFAICYQDLLRLKRRNKPEAAKQLIRLLGLDLQQHELIYSIINRVLEDDSVSSFEEFIQCVKRMKKKKDNRGVEIADDEGFSEKTVVVLVRKINLALESKYITDDPEDSINILELVRDNKVVIFKGLIKSSHSMSPAEKPFYVTFDIIYKELFDDCIAYHVNHDEDAVMKQENGVLFVFDELTMVANDAETTETRDMVSSFVLQGRAGRMDFLGIAQESSQIYKELFAQIKIIFTTWLTPSNTKMIESKGVGKQWTDKKEGGLLTTLKKGVEPIICGEKSGMRVSQIAIINSNNLADIKKCYPFPPLSASL